MAIRLASAIGEQRSVNPYEGLGDAITKAAGGVGDAFAKKQAEEAKKQAQEQKLKDAYMNLIKVEAPTGTAEQKAEYENFGKNIIAELMIMRENKKVSAAAFEKAAKEAQYGLDERAVKMKEDWDWLSKVSDPKFAEEYDTKSFNDWMIGKGSSSQVAEMEGDDFMAASTKDRAGKMPSEQGGMQATPTQTQFTGDYYLRLPFEEQKKINLRDVGTKLVTPINPGLQKAAKGYFGDSLDFGAFTTKRQNEKGGLEYSVDEAGIDKEARKFAASVLGDGNFGSKEHRLYQKYLERIAIQKGTEAGLSGDKLAQFVEDSVEKVAYDDFVRNARAASEKRMMNEKEDPLRREGKGIEINLTGSGGGSSKIWNVSDPLLKPLYEVKDGKKTENKIGDFYYHSLQTAAAGENPKKVNIGGYTDVIVEGINVNKKTGKPEYIDITVPAKYNKYDGLIEGTGVQKVVRVNKDTDIENLRNNIGKDLYDKTIGAHKPSQSETKAAPKDYGTRPDGTKKGKGYFGELKMEDGSGSVATEISMNFDDVLGGALIPSLVPTLTESEKKHLLKGNKATKEIQLKAIKHAEERASKGLSPFVDGGELKSKSGKPIYWDKTAKTYKYK